MAQNLPQKFAGLQQQAQQPNLAHLNQFLPQQQARPQVYHACNSSLTLACWCGLLLHEHGAEPAVGAEVIRAKTPSCIAWAEWLVNCCRLQRMSTLA